LVRPLTFERWPDRELGSSHSMATGLVVVAAAAACAGGCTNFVYTGTSEETVDVVRAAMERMGATQESTTRRPDLSPEELELTFLYLAPHPATSGDPAPPGDLRTILVRIVPWGDEASRQRTITLDAWRWHGVPPMWSGPAQETQRAADQALRTVLAERVP